jgi:hypothetical protein
MVLPLDPALARGDGWLSLPPSFKETAPESAPDIHKVPIRANSIRVFLSDLLFPGDPEPLLRHLGQRHGSIILFVPWIEAEARPDWSGNYDFIDTELNTRHPHRIEAATLRRYLDAYANHFSIWKNATRRHQAAFARIPAEEELLAALFREAVPVGALESC